MRVPGWHRMIEERISPYERSVQRSQDQVPGSSPAEGRSRQQGAAQDGNFAGMIVEHGHGVAANFSMPVKQEFLPVIPGGLLSDQGFVAEQVGSQLPDRIPEF